MLFKVLVLCWVPGQADLYLHSLQLYGSSGHKPHGVLKPDILGTHLFHEGPRGWVSGAGHKFLTPQGEAPYLWDPSWLWVATPRVGIVVRPDLFLSYPSQCGSCNLCFREAVQLGFMSFSEGNFACVAVVLLSPWEEGSSGSYYATVLNCLPRASFYYLNWPTLPAFHLQLFCFYYKRNKACYSNNDYPVPILLGSTIPF